jgi:hypothetical protein
MTPAGGRVKQSCVYILGDVDVSEPLKMEFAALVPHVQIDILGHFAEETLFIQVPPSAFVQIIHS